MEFDLDHIFSYHPPGPEDGKKYSDVRGAARDFAEVILQNTPPGADQSDAIRKVREAVMTANAAIALEGRLHEKVGFHFDLAIIDLDKESLPVHEYVSWFVKNFQAAGPRKEGSFANELIREHFPSALGEDVVRSSKLVEDGNNLVEWVKK